jgi:hypothetical protein
VSNPLSSRRPPRRGAVEDLDRIVTGVVRDVEARTAAVAQTSVTTIMAQARIGLEAELKRTREVREYLVWAAAQVAEAEQAAEARLAVVAATLAEPS